jgi:invasion protein IalB
LNPSDAIFRRPGHFLVCLLLPALLAFPVAAAGQWPAQSDTTRYRDWELRCPAMADNPAGAGCALVQPLLLKDGRRLMALQIAEAESRDPAGERQFAMILSAPLGVHLPSGVKIQVDDSASLELVFERCDEAGCYAGTIISDNLDGAFEQGSSLVIAIQDLNGREISARMSLLGYTAGMRALRDSGSN